MSTFPCRTNLVSVLPKAFLSRLISLSISPFVEWSRRERDSIERGANHKEMVASVFLRVCDGVGIEQLKKKLFFVTHEGDISVLFFCYQGSLV